MAIFVRTEQNQPASGFLETNIKPPQNSKTLKKNKRNRKNEQRTFLLKVPPKIKKFQSTKPLSLQTRPNTSATIYTTTKVYSLVWIS